MTASFSRRAWLILASGALIVFIALGQRHGFGLLLEPVTRNVPAISREDYGLAIAIQNFLWGLGQPFAGWFADRWGSARVIAAGGLFYGGGLALAASADGPLILCLGLGGLVGLGLSATSYAVVLGAVGRFFPQERRATALGIATLGGSVGIFCAVPIVLGLIERLGWSGALIGLAILSTIMIFASPALAGRAAAGPGQQDLRAVLSEALRHRGFVLLVLGFFVCGFQLAFIATHLPAYLADRQVAPVYGGLALALIGATNIFGTIGWGWLGDRASKRKLLALLYLIRGAFALWFFLQPVTPFTVIVFALLFGASWLGTVPLTSGIVAQIFGSANLAMLVGIVFLMHQVGGALGAWLGGYVFDRWGSYDPIWWSVALLGFVAALLHWPIDERPLAKQDEMRAAAE